MAKKIRKSRDAAVHNNAGDSLKLIAFTGVCLLLLLALFFRGLFFPEDQLKGLLFISLIFMLVLLYKWKSRDSSFLALPQDYFMLAIPLVYILSAINSVNHGLAADEIVEVLLYILFYLCIVNLVRHRKDINILMCVIYAGGVSVALAGLMSATNLISIKDGVQQGIRISSTLQYPNALAAYLLAVLTAGVFLWRGCGAPEERTQEKKYIKYALYVFTAGNCLLAAVILGTDSNGGYITFALAVLLMLLLFPGWSRLFIFLHLASVIPPAAAGMHYFQANLLTKQYAVAWLCLLLGLLTALIIQWLCLRFVHGYITQLQKRSISKKAVAGAVAVFILAAALPFLYLSEVPGGLQSFIKMRSIMDRAYFISDAFQMFKDRPLLGWGGGGWQEAYQFYQSYSYTSTLVHSYFVQIAIETGIIGLIVVAAVWIFFFLSCCRTYRRTSDSDSKALIAALAVGVFALGFHSSLDFDLSLSAISLVLFTFMAIARNMEKTASSTLKNEKNTKGISGSFILASAGCLTVIILAGCLLLAEAYKRDALYYTKQNNYGKAVQSMEMAVLLSPHRSEYRHFLAELYWNTGQKDKAFGEAQKAVEKSRYNLNRWAFLTSFALERGDVKESVRLVEEVIRLGPWVISGYESAAIVYKAVGLAELKNGRASSAGEYFAAAARLPDTVNNKINSLDPNRKKLILDFGVTGKIMLASGASNLLLGDTAKAEYQLKEAALKEETKGEALVWLSLLSEKLGDPGNAELYLKKARDLSPEYEKAYREYKGLVK